MPLFRITAHHNLRLLALFPAPDIAGRSIAVGGPPSNLPIALAARAGQLVLSAALTDDLLSGCF